MVRVVLIGGGLSGMSAAVRIRRRMPGVHLTVLEERTRAGGNIHTEQRDGFTVEHGPNGFLDGKPATLQLSRDLGLEPQLVAGSEAARKNRYLYWNDQLQKLPGDPLGLLRTPLLTWRGKLAMLLEPFRRRPGNLPPEESVAAFARRRFGKEAADVFIDALVTGIHAGDPERLGVRAAFPRLTAMEADAGSVFRGVLRAGKLKKAAARSRGEKPLPQRMWSFKHGLKTLIDAMAEQLGESLVMGVQVKRIEKTGSGWLVRGEGSESWPADVVLNTAPAFRQAEQVADLDPAFAEELALIRYSAVNVAVLGYKRNDAARQPDGFGYIAPQVSGRSVLGVQWCSSIYPERAPPGFVLWRALCGGVNRPDVAALSDDELLKLVHREMQVALGVSAPPVFTQVVRWPHAIPQYEVGHVARVARLERLAARHRGLILGGNAFHGIAMNDCTERAEGIAEAISDYRPNP